MSKSTFLSSARLFSLALVLSLAGLMTLPPQPVKAEEIRYSKPALTVIVRKEASNSSPIIAYLPLDMPVTLLQEEWGWARIQLRDGKIGWLNARSLSKTAMIAPNEEQGTTEAEASGQNIQQNFKRLGEENARLRQELADCSSKLKTLDAQYQATLSDPESAAHLKGQLATTEAQLVALRAQEEEAQIENTVLKKNQSIKWFVVGGSVLLLGWIIGRMSSGNRKKKSSLL